MKFSVFILVILPIPPSIISFERERERKKSSQSKKNREVKQERKSERHIGVEYIHVETIQEGERLKGFVWVFLPW